MSNADFEDHLNRIKS